MKYSTDDEIAFHNRTKRYYRSSPKLVDEALFQDAQLDSAHPINRRSARLLLAVRVGGVLPVLPLPVLPVSSSSCVHTVLLLLL